MDEIQTIKNKRTKILATIGPASDTVELIEQLARAGMNGARQNMSHGAQEWHAESIKKVRDVSAKLGKPIAVLVDLQGPKIRLGNLPDQGLNFKGDEVVEFAYGDNYSEGSPVPVQYDISKYVRPGQPMYLRDGLIAGEILEVNDGRVKVRLHNSGIVFSKQGLNLPDTDLSGDIFTEKDLADIDFALEQNADYIALSFVQTANDINNLRAKLDEKRSKALIVAKIETKAAVDNIEEIVKAADAIMVARGDLAVEVGPERVPVIQRQLVKAGQAHKKPVIVATQMLESMVSVPQATRAEVGDVATAVVQGADAVMLSAESATGKYPVEAVALMKRVILYSEQNMSATPRNLQEEQHSFRDAISTSVITLARQLNAKLILAETATGKIVRHISSFRSEVQLLGVTDRYSTYNQLALVWGARAYLIKDPATAHDEVIEVLKSEHNVDEGDVIVRTFGKKAGVTATTDTIQVEKI